MEYRTVTRETAYDLTFQVNAWIEKGWEPIGGVSIDKVGKTTTFCQAMIKK